MSEMSPPLLLALPKTTGRTPIPSNLLNERREMAVSLKTAGLAMASVLKEINRMSEGKNWGKITLRTLERDIATYYRKNRVIKSEEREHWERMRDAHLAQMENTLESLSLYVVEKNKNNAWQRFEKPLVLDKVFRMQMGLAELNGWNYSRTNNNNIKITNNTVVSVYDEGAQTLINAQPELIRDIVGILHSLQSNNTLALNGEEVEQPAEI